SRCSLPVDIQAVSGGLLRPVDCRQRCAVRPGRRHHRAALAVPQPPDDRSMTRRPLHIVGGVAAVLVSAVVFLVPFAFIIIQALKDVRESSDRSFALPTTWHLWDNLTEVLSKRDYMLVTAFINSIILAVAGVGLLVVFGAMVGFVLQRRPSRWTNVINFF